MDKLFEGIEFEDTAASVFADVVNDDVNESSEENNENNESIDNEQESVNEDDNSHNDDDSSVSKDNDSDASSSPYIALLESLHESGVITSLNLEELKDKEVSYDTVRDIVDKEINDNVSAYKDTLPDYLREEIELLESGVSQEEIASLRKLKEDWDSISDEDVSSNIILQKKIVREDLEGKGMSRDEIDEIIETYEDTDKLESKSISALAKKKDGLSKAKETAKETAKAEKARMEEMRAKQLDQIKESVYSMDEFLPNVKASKKFKDDLYKSMTTIVGKDANGNPLNAVMSTRAKNPIEFEKGIHALHALGVLNIDDKGNFAPDWKSIMKLSETSSVKKLDNILNKKNNSVDNKNTASKNLGEIELDDEMAKLWKM